MPQGKAVVSVTLPDNLTTWRLDGRGVTVDTKVGQATVDIQTSLPLLVRPVLPRFFVVADEAEIGAVVNNNTDKARTVDVIMTTQGVTTTQAAHPAAHCAARRAGTGDLAGAGAAAGNRLASNRSRHPLHGDRDGPTRSSRRLGGRRRNHTTGLPLQLTGDRRNRRNSRSGRRAHRGDRAAARRGPDPGRAAGAA